MGLIHSLANTNVLFVPGSPLAKFIEECKGTLRLLHPLLPDIDQYLGKTPEERAKLLETTPLFGKIHESAASSGQTAVPQDLDTDLHFTCFVKAPATKPTSDAAQRWRLIELDGGRIGPIDRGECDDLLKACPYTPNFRKVILTRKKKQDTAKYVKEFYVSQAKSISFNMMALCPGPEKEY
ncbi:hypothetical protein JVT61DRAFT_7469 [Boletus reticuloceps]|uniref:ubiquitinyl hydrolase 1 n=1 Tax=Boletus reticuloceps TaxID=495285 RepID=A0A8I2YJ25_9AGAM|nr:hypothetical protein JVT61DRAFT_7469 [Boletus reticuloceps]